MNDLFAKRPWLPSLLLLVVLGLASLLAVSLVSVRILYSGRNTYLFLVWNLFLAWLPLGMAWLAYRWRNRWLPLLGVGGLWLLFLPNAPYITTDLLHLRPLAAVPLWYDLIMLLTFALTGLLIGFWSLYLMHTIVAQRWGRPAGWLFAVVCLELSSIGVYIGRFLRWNSWDLFIDPARLLHDVGQNLLALRPLVMTSLMSVLFLLLYLALALLPHLAARTGTSAPSEMVRR